MEVRCVTARTGDVVHVQMVVHVLVLARRAASACSPATGVHHRFLLVFHLLLLPLPLPLPLPLLPLLLRLLLLLLPLMLLLRLLHLLLLLVLLLVPV